MPVPVAIVPLLSAGADALTTGNLIVTASVFGGVNAGNGNMVTGGVGGAGGVGGVGFTAGNGGMGGNGGASYGGAISGSDTVGSVTITTSSFIGNAVTSGTGGAGGATGSTLTTTLSGAGGNGGVAYGGAVSYHIPLLSSDTTTNSISITSTLFSSDTVTSGQAKCQRSGEPFGGGGNCPG